MHVTSSCYVYMYMCCFCEDFAILTSDVTCDQLDLVVSYEVVHSVRLAPRGVS